MLEIYPNHQGQELRSYESELHEKYFVPRQRAQPAARANAGLRPAWLILNVGAEKKGPAEGQRAGVGFRVIRRV